MPENCTLYQIYYRHNIFLDRFCILFNTQMSKFLNYFTTWFKVNYDFMANSHSSVSISRLLKSCAKKNKQE